MTNEEFDSLITKFLWILATISLLGIGVQIKYLSANLISLNKSIQNIDSSIRSQTGQVDWLVRHYAKPVRPLYPWEKHKCEWCGSTILESEDKIYNQDKPVVWNITTLYGGPVEVTDEKNKRIVLEMCVPDAKLKAKEIAKDRNLKVIFQEHCETPDGLE